MCVMQCNFTLLIVLLQNAKPTLGSKPCLVFTGDAFDADAEYKRLKNCLIGEILTDVISVLHIPTPIDLISVFKVNYELAVFRIFHA